MKSKTEGLEPHTDFLWSRVDYENLVRRGIFGPEDHLELLDGRLITMAPQNSPHRTALNLVRVYLDQVLTASAHLCIQSPLALGSRSMPEPDLAVVPGCIRDYTGHHPSTALLVVEVADSSLAYDRGPKLRAYARAGILEYWIVNLIDHQIEVHRNPREDAYEVIETIRPGAHLHPLGQQAHSVDAAELLP